MTTSTTTTLPREFAAGDYVLYRDPNLFWRGESDHTKVCWIYDCQRYATGVRYTLHPVTGGTISNAQGDYMRLLPPADAMRDIDTTPVNALGSAAVAWLTQQASTERPELPAR
ncbi:hypothetical protein [Streptomyces buecherae]|uniref:Uncharacterized protein n=1 Tax=Streptomyces buecherae TaxID=2763006 RepID=A0A7H8NKB8_9ACTN|nr:hypothetical protein [Streptomyces buecherae]QKW55037.1 hypothetical protein HUT08_36520 [Streptomyces buecherae]